MPRARDAADQQVQLILGRMDANQRLIVVHRTSMSDGEFEALSERQSSTLIAAIGMLPGIEDEEAADACEKIGGMSWPQDRKDRCLLAVRNLLDRRPQPEAVALGVGRAQMQDFSCLEKCLPLWLWNLNADAFGEYLVRFLVCMMGCVHPSEPTIQKVVALTLLQSAAVDRILVMPWQSKKGVSPNREEPD